MPSFISPIAPPPPPSELDALRESHPHLYHLWIRSGVRFSAYLQQHGLAAPVRASPPPPPIRPSAVLYHHHDRPSVSPKTTSMGLAAGEAAPATHQTPEPGMLSKAPSRDASNDCLGTLSAPERHTGKQSRAPACCLPRQTPTQPTQPVPQQQYQYHSNPRTQPLTTASAPGASKRLELGKRKMAQLEGEQRHFAKQAAARFRPATDEELARVEASPGPLAFLWHYADGSTSVRRIGLAKDAAFDPIGESRAVGVTVLVPTPPPLPLHGHATGITSHAMPQLSAVGCTPLLHAATSPAATAAAEARAPATLPALHSDAAADCTYESLHWPLPARLRVKEGTGDGTDPPTAPPPRGVETQVERGWQLVRQILCGERRDPGGGTLAVAIVAPNAKLVHRTLALACTHSSSASPHHAPHGGPSMWAALDAWTDPITLAHLLEPDAAEEHLLLPYLAQRYLASGGGDGATGSGGSDAGGGGRGGGAQGGGGATTLTTAGGDVAAHDLALSLTLSRVLFARLQERLGARHAAGVVQREMRVAELLATMELRGLPCDASRLTTHRRAIVSRLDELSKQAESLLRRPVNLASPQQCSEALYVTLSLPPPTQAAAATRATHGSTSEAHLADLARRFPSQPLPALILEHRELSKLLTAFIDPYAQRVRAGRLHTEWHAHTTGTGRLSSRHPNVQQVPKRPADLVAATGAAGAADAASAAGSGGEDSAPVSTTDTTTSTTRGGGGGGSRRCSIFIRDAFRPVDGTVLLAADYNQLEMRLMACMANDPELQRQMAAGGDLFARLASVWRRIPLGSVTPTARGQTKQICYGLIYGLGVERLAASLQVSIAEARTLKHGFLSCFTELQRFTEQCKRYARQHWSVRTLGGRQRPLAHIASANGNERAKAERQAVNTVVQGSAADLMKEAMLRLVEGLSHRGVRARLVAQIHDEVLLEVDEAQLHAAAATVRRALEHVTLDGRALPRLPVSLCAGRSWGQMAPLPLAE